LRLYARGNLRSSASEQDYGAGGGFAAACQASLAQAACLVLLVVVMWWGLCKLMAVWTHSLNRSATTVTGTTVLEQPFCNNRSANNRSITTDM
jgi:hypothetical protein